MAGHPEGRLGSLAARRAIYSRNSVAWISLRSWRKDVKRRDIRALKLAKEAVDPVVIAGAAAEVAGLVKLLLGGAPGFTVSTVAVGHSRRPDSFAVRMAEAAAAELELPFVKIFADRFVNGVSHPKELKKLRPLERLALPATPVLLVDDVASSGWHLEEAVTNLRAAGVTCLAIAWISGTIGSAVRPPLDFGLEPLERSDRIKTRLMLASSFATLSR